MDLDPGSGKNANVMSGFHSELGIKETRKRTSPQLGIRNVRQCEMTCFLHAFWQKKQEPQEMVKGTTTRAPDLILLACPSAPPSIISPITYGLAGRSH